LVTEAHVCEQLAQGRYPAVSRCGASELFQDYKSDTLPLGYRATLTATTTTKLPGQSSRKQFCMSTVDPVQMAVVGDLQARVLSRTRTSH